MNNKWEKTFDALRGILKVLSCSKCKRSLHDPQQFLTCGHFSCNTCINNNVSKCVKCEAPCKNGSIVRDETIQKIITACCTIAVEVGFRETSENNEFKPKEIPSVANENVSDKEIPLAENNENTSNIAIKSESGISNVDSDDSEFKTPTKLLNGKRRKNLKYKEDSKRVKLTEQVTTFRIPKIINKKNHHGETVLHKECKRGHIENVTKLLEAGADPNTSCYAEWTPLQECADYGFYDIAEMLLVNGASVNQIGHEGKTALHQAVESDMTKLVQLLLRFHAKKDIIDKKGKKPIDYCKTQEMQNLLNLHENGTFFKEEEVSIKNESNPESTNSLICTINIEETINDVSQSDKENDVNMNEENNCDEISVIYSINKTEENNYPKIVSCYSMQEENRNLGLKPEVQSSSSERSINFVSDKENLNLAINDSEVDLRGSQESIDVVNSSQCTIFPENYYNNNQKGDDMVSEYVNEVTFTDSEEYINIID